MDVNVLLGGILIHFTTVRIQKTAVIRNTYEDVCGDFNECEPAILV